MLVTDWPNAVAHIDADCFYAACERLRLAGGQEPISRQVTGLEPEPRREMPVPAVATVGSQIEEDPRRHTVSLSRG
jgi:hypothetical protein